MFTAWKCPFSLFNNAFVICMCVRYFFFIHLFFCRVACCLESNSECFSPNIILTSFTISSFHSCFYINSTLKRNEKNQKSFSLLFTLQHRFISRARNNVANNTESKWTKKTAMGQLRKNQSFFGLGWCFFGYFENSVHDDYDNCHMHTLTANNIKQWQGEVNGTKNEEKNKVLCNKMEFIYQTNITQRLKVIKENPRK